MRIYTNFRRYPIVRTITFPTVLDPTPITENKKQISIQGTVVDLAVTNSQFPTSLKTIIG